MIWPCVVAERAPLTILAGYKSAMAAAPVEGLNPGYVVVRREGDEADRWRADGKAFFALEQISIKSMEGRKS